MSERQIPIHPERGLDPHLTFCPRCGGETNGLTIGVIRKAEIPNGQLVYAQRGSEQKMRKRLLEQGMISDHERLDWRELGENERVPDSSVCEQCKTELTDWADLVKQGGCYFKCNQCGCNGVINPGSEMAAAVRKATGKPPPQPCGVAFETCDSHKATIEEETDDGKTEET